MAIVNRRRLKELEFLEGFLKEYPNLTQHEVRIVMAANMGWSFTKTRELLKVIEGTKSLPGIKAFEMPKEEDAKRPDTWGKFEFPKRIA